MQARADERVVKAEQRADDARAEVESAKVERVSGSTSLWAESRARALGEVHEDLVARAAAVGMGEPVPERPRRGRLLGAVGDLVVMDGSGVHGEPRDPYREWRDRIVLEEAAAVKAARGESLSLVERAALKAARLLSK